MSKDEHIDDETAQTQASEEETSGVFDATEQSSGEAKRIEELTQSLQRLQAEFENYRKRTEKESLDFRKYATKSLVEKLLSVLDYFELALKNTKHQEEFVKGIEMTYSHLFSTLESEGLKPIEVKGKNCDPNLHEALLQEEVDGKKSGEIIEELQKGYFLGDKVLRPSKVKIAK